MYLPLEFPPGLYRNGTERQAKGRWLNANLIRFYEGTIRPIGGWTPKIDEPLNGMGRAIITWRDNSQVVWSAIGTDQRLYVITVSGYLYDITPAGYVPGASTASLATGYGGGDYGQSAYGRDDVGGAGAPALAYGGGNYGVGDYNTTAVQGGSSTIQPATVWSFDNWGEDLIGCTRSDGRIYQWPPNTNAAAAVLTNAPTANAVVVTDQRILMAVGAAGVPRRVQWSDQGNNTLWTPAATNQAGSYDLSTAGRLVLGKRFRGQVVLLTDIDAHLATYTNDVFVYGFQVIGTGCGAISANCAAALGDFVVWMSNGAFYTFNGYVEKLACEVSDFLFGNLNATQASKVSCFVNSAFSEVSWFYPSVAATEVDSYVTWNYRENHWTTGSLARVSGIDRGPLSNPLLVGADGYVYEHESGFFYGGAAPWLESGPFELGNGDVVFYARQLVPDEKTEGDVKASFKVKFYPNGPETVFGPYTLTEPTDVRFCARAARLRYDAVSSDDWRVGSPRLEVTPGGGR